MVNWRLGTIGFSYKDWNTVFYPVGLQPRDYLAHYSQIFNAVELDSTFYGTPKPEYVERWALVTPPDFTFCVKAPREITHEMRLVGVDNALESFLSTMQLLGDKLGVVLFQLPPDFTFAQIHVLAVFLRNLPTHIRYAVEFRHPSWNTTAAKQLLQNQSVSWVSAAYKHLSQQVFVTTDFIYIRWIGVHGQYDIKDHERIDPTPQLAAWWDDIQTQMTSFDSVYGFFNDDFSGHAPATCNRFKQMVGLEITDTRPPQQGRLF